MSIASVRNLSTLVENSLLHSNEPNSSNKHNPFLKWSIVYGKIDKTSWILSNVIQAFYTRKSAGHTMCCAASLVGSSTPRDRRCTQFQIPMVDQNERSCVQFITILNDICCRVIYGRIVVSANTVVPLRVTFVLLSLKVTSCTARLEGRGTSHIYCSVLCEL